MRFASVMETLGSVTGIKRRLPSSKGGMNSEPILSIIGMVMRSATTFIASVVLRNVSAFLRIGSYILISKREIGFFSSGRNLPRMSIVISIGTNVIEIIAEAARAKVLVQARG